MPHILRPPPWTASAACVGQVTPGWDPWHPADELPAKQRKALSVVARRVCAGCPVRHPCALEALHNAIPYGMYGGLDPADRRQIARRFGYPQPGAAQHGSRSKYVTGCTDGADGKACRPCLDAHRAWVAERRAKQPVDHPRAPRVTIPRPPAVPAPAAHPWRTRNAGSRAAS